MKRFMLAESEIRGRNILWKTIQRDVPQQDDSKSCGLFLCANAFHEVGSHTNCTRRSRLLGRPSLIEVDVHARFYLVDFLVDKRPLSHTGLVSQTQKCISTNEARFTQADTHNMRRRIVVEVCFQASPNK